MQPLALAEAAQKHLDLVPARHSSWCKRVRAILTTGRTVGILVGVAFASFAVFVVLEAFLGGDIPATTAARFVSSTCGIVMATSLWLSMDLRVVKILATRARYMRIASRPRHNPISGQTCL